MKKIILLAILVAGCNFIAGAQTTKVSERTSVNGTSYVSSSTRGSSSSSDVKTEYTWSKSGSEVSSTIYLHKYSRGENAGRWTAYIFKISKKTGKEYKYYLPDGMAIADDIIKHNPNLIK